MSIRDRNDIEIYEENSSIFCRFWKSNPHRNFHVESMTWILLSKSMKYRRNFHVEFQRQINSESTKMCHLGKAYGNDIQFRNCFWNHTKTENTEMALVFWQRHILTLLLVTLLLVISKRMILSQINKTCEPLTFSIWFTLHAKVLMRCLRRGK